MCIRDREEGPQEATVDAVNRRGRHIEVRVLGSALRDSDGGVVGIILSMERTEAVGSTADGSIGQKTAAGSGSGVE